MTLYAPRAMILTFAVIVSIVYIALGWAARSHVPPDRKTQLSKAAPTYFYYWPFYGDLFGPTATKLRRWGWFLFAVMVVSYVLAFTPTR